MAGCPSETGTAWRGCEEEGSSDVALEGRVSRHCPAELLATRDSHPGLKASYRL